MSDLQCCVMHEEDIESAVSIFLTYYNTYEDGEWTHETAYRRIHAIWSCEDSMCLLLEQGSRPIGFVIGYLEQYDDLLAYDLVEIVLEKRAQGQGIGTQFMQMIEAQAKQRGAALIQLLAVNDAMHEHFYGKLGFVSATNLVLKSKTL